ncbi:MAG: hypothetical protein V4494_00615 [Chlamydiota bacterium]
MTSLISNAAESCLDVAKEFLPGSMTQEERITTGMLGIAGVVTTAALAIFAAPPIALGIVGGISATILVGAILGSRGISYSAVIAAGILFIAGAITGHIPIVFAIAL